MVEPHEVMIGTNVLMALLGGFYKKFSDVAFLWMKRCAFVSLLLLAGLFYSLNLHFCDSVIFLKDTVRLLP